jgi:hypothetical protein
MPFAEAVVAVVVLVREVMEVGRASLGSARVEVRKRDMRRDLKSIINCWAGRLDLFIWDEMGFCLVWRM